MAINDDVFRAILAMDSYNRGYNAGINFGPASDANGTQNWQRNGPFSPWAPTMSTNSSGWAVSG